jgi:hypothetical protein
MDRRNVLQLLLAAAQAPTVHHVAQLLPGVVRGAPPMAPIDWSDWNDIVICCQVEQPWLRVNGCAVSDPEVWQQVGKLLHTHAFTELAVAVDRWLDRSTPITIAFRVRENPHASGDEAA